MEEEAGDPGDPGSLHIPYAQSDPEHTSPGVSPGSGAPRIVASGVMPRGGRHDTTDRRESSASRRQGMTAFMSAEEVERARTRFCADQDEAEYLEYAEAMARIGPTRYWRRHRRRFLDQAGYELVDRGYRAGEAGDG